jgi:hypothetical protein
MCDGHLSFADEEEDEEEELYLDAAVGVPNPSGKDEM